MASSAIELANGAVFRGREEEAGVAGVARDLVDHASVAAIGCNGDATSCGEGSCLAGVGGGVVVEAIGGQVAV